MGVLMWGPSPVRGGRRRAVTVWDSSGVRGSKWRWWAHATPVPGSPGGAWVRVGVAVGMWVAEALLVGGWLMLALVLAVTLIEWAALALQTIPGRGTAPTPVAGGPGGSMVGWR